MRKGFNFFKSYYDVYKELNNNDKVKFVDALLDKQFNGVDPTKLKGMANFAYISQKHSIDAQVKGWEDKTGNKLTPTEGGRQGGLNPPTLQVEVEGEVQVEGKGEVQLKGVNYSFDEFWNLYDKKVGDKSKLEKKWNSLDDNTRTKILFHVREYKISQPDKKYRKNPETYFNNKSWNDEIINNNNNGQRKIDEVTGIAERLIRRTISETE